MDMLLEARLADGGQDLQDGLSDSGNSNPTIGLVHEPLALYARSHDPAIWLALAVATLMHALLLMGFLHFQPRIVGDPAGSNDPIAISIVSREEFLKETSQSEVADQPPAAAPRPDESQSQQNKPEPPSKAPQPAKQPHELPPEPQTEAKSEEKAEPQEKSPSAPALESGNPGPLSLSTPAPPEPKESASDPPARQEPSKQSEKNTRKQPDKPSQRLSKLDLRVPTLPDGASAIAGGGASFQRPPGITKSGANDEFARAVIRALQKTMPPSDGTFGHVTVRILLDENGNVVKVDLLGGTANVSLKQQVIFAARQTTYPFPVPHSNLADRTFLVTYVYH